MRQDLEKRTKYQERVWWKAKLVDKKIRAVNRGAHLLF